MKTIAKWFARLIVGEYRFNRIYRFDPLKSAPLPAAILAKNAWRFGSLVPNDLEKATDTRIRAHAWYGGENSYGFGVWEQDELVSATWFWNNQRFKDRGIWELGTDEAIMVDLLTAERHRGKGLAPLLTQFAVHELRKQNFRMLYTWVWHSNHPSIRSFEKAGWTRIAYVVELNLFHLKRIRHVRMA
jgi:GNAT superfamily N-acetyltransferase